MPARNLPLVNGEYYHVYNRGVARMPIFITSKDNKRFFDSVVHYLDFNVNTRFSKSSNKDLQKPNKQIVEIISYCFMPNHFHFLLKQNENHGIMNFTRKISNSYARYFNIKHKRKGPLFEGKFKAIRIESNEQLLHLTRYIHLNPLIGHVTTELNSYKWSSYLEYLGLSELEICSKNVVLGQFDSQKSYQRFILDHIDYARKLDKLKHILLEENR